MCFSSFVKNDPFFPFPGGPNLRVVCLSVFSSPSVVAQWGGYSIRPDPLLLRMPVAPFSVDAGIDLYHWSFERSLHGTADQRSRGLHGCRVHPGLSVTGINHATVASFGSP